MKYQKVTIAMASAVTIALSGCASQGTRSDNAINPFCALVGGAAAGGTAAALSAAAGPIGAAVFAGGILGAWACAKDDAPAVQAVAPVPAKAAMTPAPATPAPTPDPDSDGDGVVDSLDRCPGTPPGTKVDANGCPDILMTLTGVNFKFDSSNIEPKSTQILDQAVDALTKANSVDVRIVGHTDSTGPDAYNQKLSERRASAVRDYLIEHGVVGTRLSVEGHGEQEPVAPNETDEGRYQNRRVELRVAGAEMGNRSGDESWRKLADPAMDH